MNIGAVLVTLDGVSYSSWVWETLGSRHRISDVAGVLDLAEELERDNRRRYEKWLSRPASIRGLDADKAHRTLQKRLRVLADALNCRLHLMVLRRYASAGTPGRLVVTHPRVVRGPNPPVLQPVDHFPAGVMRV